MNRKYWIGLLLLTGCLKAPALPPSDKPPSAAKVNPQAPWPMFGGTPSRNMVNTFDKNIPTTWNVEEGQRKNIKWVADLGNRAYGGPVVADGKVFVGTTNSRPRDKNIKGLKSVLMAFNEADGRFLWQLVHDIPEDDPTFNMGKQEGLCSTPVVEGKKLYYVTQTCELICAGTDGKVQWTYDMMKKLKVVPHDLGNCSPLIHGDLVMVVTSNGTDAEGKIPSPKAPSFIAVNKKTGILAWQSNLPGNNILEGQWSNPTLATVNGKTQVIFPGGDAFLYAFEPETGDLIWKCDCNPTRKKKEDGGDNYIVSTPVVVGDRLYVGLGVCPDSTIMQAPRYSYFVCLDTTKKGDVSPKNQNAKDPANKNSALIWSVGGPIMPAPAKGREYYFGPTISTAAVHDGLVYISEMSSYLHCLDAKTGQRYYAYDFKDGIWGSPYYVDGKIYLALESGDIAILAHGKECKYYVKGKLVAATPENDERSASMEEANLHTTPIVANGVLYIATKSKLYAIAQGK